MQKARSRLQKDQETTRENIVVLEKKEPAKKKEEGVRGTYSSHTPSKSKSKSSKYIKHSPMLLLSITCFYICYFIITHYYPEQVANVLIPGAYLPLLIPFYLGVYFAASYVTLNSMIGFIFSILATVRFFLKLQQIW